MLAQLGSTVFEALFSFDEFKRKKAGIYAELPLVNGKPDLQRIGTALDVIDINIRLHDSFCIPYLRYDELVSYVDNGDVLPFVDGYGDVIGSYVIVELEQEVLQTDRKGRVTHCTCKLVLTEYVDPNRALSKSNEAKRNAIAVGATSLSLKINSAPASPEVDVFKSVRAINDGSSAAGDAIANAVKNPSSVGTFINRASAAVDDVAAAADRVQSKVQDYGSQIANGANIVASAVAVKNNAVALKQSLASGDLANAQSGFSLLNASVTQVGVYSQAIQKVIILR